MFGLGNFELWGLAIACIITGLPIIGMAVWVLVALSILLKICGVPAEPNKTADLLLMALNEERQ